MTVLGKNRHQTVTKTSLIRHFRHKNVIKSDCIKQYDDRLAKLLKQASKYPARKTGTVKREKWRVLERLAERVKTKKQKLP